MTLTSCLKFQLIHLKPSPLVNEMQPILVESQPENLMFNLCEAGLEIMQLKLIVLV